MFKAVCCGVKGVYAKKAIVKRHLVLRIRSNNFLAIIWEKNVVEGRSVEFEILIFLFLMCIYSFS